MRGKLLRWAILPSLAAAALLGVLFATDRLQIANDTSFEPGQAAVRSSAVASDPAIDREGSPNDANKFEPRAAQRSPESSAVLANPFSGAAPSDRGTHSRNDNPPGSAQRYTESSPRSDDATRRLAADNLAEYDDDASSTYNESQSAAYGEGDDPYAEDAGEAAASVEDDPAAAEDQQPRDVHIIAGRVLNEAGETLAGIELIATLNRYDESGAALPGTALTQRTVSDGLGHYIFQGLPDGMYLITTVRTPRHPAARIWVRAGVDYADLVVATQVVLRLYGTVTDTAYKPLSAVSIDAWAPDVIGTRSDDNGWFELLVPLHGNARSLPVRFTRTGYEIHEIRLDEKGWETGSVIALDVALVPIGTSTDVTGTLRSTTGEPVAGEKVTLFCATELRLHEAVSGEDGSFSIPDVISSNDCKLQVVPLGPYESYVQSGLSVGPGMDLEIVLQRRAFGSVSGQMVDSSGNSISGLELTLRSLASNKRVDVSGDSRGRFTIHELPEGDVVFEQKPMPNFTIDGIRVSAREVTHALLVLDVGTQQIQGRVLDAAGNPMSASKVSLHWEHVQRGVRSSSSRTAVTDAYGVFSFTGAGPGVHSIVVNVPGYKTARVDHDSMEQAEVVLQLEALAAN